MDLGEAHYRDVMLQMQSEFARAVDAFEKQIQWLTKHNELLVQSQSRHEIQIQELSSELLTTQQQREQAQRTIQRLQDQQGMIAEDKEAQAMQSQQREDALQMECEALKTLLQQEQSYWQRYEKTRAREMALVTQQVADAKALALQKQERNDRLRQEAQLLQDRVDAAVRTSRSFEQRLKQLSNQRDEERMEMQSQIQQLTRRLNDKREQNKYLTQALVEKQTHAPTTTRRSGSSSIVSSSSRSSSSSSSLGVSSQSSDSLERRVRKRDVAPLTISSSALHVGGRMYERKHLDDLHSHAPTSPTVSSPDVSPPVTPQKRQPSPTKTSKTRGTSDRYEREMSLLRRKLDACTNLSS